ncbi:MAG TPA: glutathione S-transferase family protein [Solirubrobacterales bacterium]|nr:glutathione S-transferase family protein [Solirubrobacterales bacterium]
MSLLLYDNPVSGNCFKVRLLLTLLGIEFERQELSVVDHSDRPEILGGLSPALSVPTVVLEDGRPLAESNAILWYFADGTRYLPDDPHQRAQVLQWLFFEQSDVDATIAVARFWVSIIEDPPAPGVDVEALQKAGRAALRWSATSAPPSSSSASASRSPTSPSTPTPTSPPRAASTSSPTPPSAPGLAG